MTPLGASRLRPHLVPVLAALLVVATLVPAAEDEPDYPHGNYQDDCTMCHSPDGWTPAVIGPEFDHAKSGFQLQGTHAQTKCVACHVSLEFNRTQSACVACHDDLHLNELGTDCSMCHTPRSFIDRTWMTQMHMTTRFPLTGSHRITDCEHCHTPTAFGNLQWLNTPVECEACHLEAYLATTNPDHQAGSFPRTCENCHSTRTWRPAAFNHATLPVGTQCVSCHLSDYQSTMNPDHQAAGFGQQCETCHSTNRWVPASFDGLNHDGAFFPIFSGRHRGQWNQCSDCHVVPNNFGAFECIQCHEHDDPTDLAGKHSGVSGYQYNSQACYSCHPRGEEDG